MSEEIESSGEEEATLLGREEASEEVSRDTTEDEGKEKPGEESKDEGEKKDEGKEKPGEEESKDEGKEKPGEESKEKEEKAGAPDKYEDFTIPDGFEVDDKRLGAFQEFGQEHGLTQEAAQALVDLHVSAIKEITDQTAAQWSTIKEGWVTEVKADKALHDEEGNPDAAIASAVRAVEILGGDELKEALNITGAGSHPAVVRAFYEIGKHVEDDKIVFGSGSAGGPKTGARSLYPSMSK